MNQLKINIYVNFQFLFLRSGGSLLIEEPRSF